MERYFADLHIHIGRSSNNHPIKITASNSLTFENIVIEAKLRKGLDIIGIIDCASPPVIDDIKRLIASEQLVYTAGGGYLYRGDMLVILGVEVEINQEGYGAGHFLCYFRNVEIIEEFSGWLSQYITNIQLSTQVARVSVRQLQEKVKELQGLFVPAHIFTPHKGIYGNMTSRMAELLDINMVDAVELGLSADSLMAAHILELKDITFLTNSDAHSLPKIAREYNEFILDDLSFDGIASALHRVNENYVAANYGMEPRLGKYHRSHCVECDTTANETNAPPILICPNCNSKHLTIGVYDRIVDISEAIKPLYTHIQPYKYQIPIEFIPKIGSKTMQKLYYNFHTEMNIIHNITFEELVAVVGESIANLICQAREGNINLVSGGGGTYGKLEIQ